MNGTDLLYKTNISFVIVNVGCFMTQPISVIARSLVRERQRTGLSLAEIARRAGIAKSTLSQLEAGNGNPSPETLWSLCVALDIPLPGCWSRRYKNAGDSPRRRHQSGGGAGALSGDITGGMSAGARRDIYLLLTQPGPTGSLTRIRRGRWNILLLRREKPSSA